MSALREALHEQRLDEPGESEFPPDELRFTLEFAHRPNRRAVSSKLRQLLKTPAFALQPLPGQHEFLVLRFPGIERTLPPRQLFDIGYELAAELDLVSAEPDLGTRLYADPEPPAVQPRTETADIIGGLCWVKGDPPSDRRWALQRSNLLDAWQLSTGAGSIIAQPDTGVTDHSELGGGMLDLARAWDFVAGVAGASDPLNPKTANPGHGTGTASVVASRPAGDVVGAAPGATLIPIRCIEDVKVFDASPVAAAVSYAVQLKAHVISMSLGGVPSRALHAAIRKAVSAGIIVVAAAGNCVRIVVWPARYDEVIAVAGCNISDKVWKGSSRGGSIDITAPAEFVWRAQRTSIAEPNSNVAAGQGTSFATALVAGTAALWLSHHGRAKVIDEARRRGSSVNELFRAALKSSARKPGGWDVDDFGPGILDARKLIELKLGDIPGIAEARTLERSSIERALDEELGPGPRDRDFPFELYGAEIGKILLEQSRLGLPPTTISPETKAPTTRPSTSLSDAVRDSRDERLSRLGEHRGAHLVRPPAIAAGRTDERRLGAALTLRGTALESTRGRLGPDAIRKHLEATKTEQLDRLRARLSDMPDIKDTDKASMESLADRALDELKAGRPRSRATSVALEALIRLNGRPALRVRNGVVDFEDPEAGEWQDKLLLWQQGDDLKERMARVGRIEAAQMHIGTGFVVAPGVIMTNRHVLQEFAAPIPRRNRPQRWALTEEDVLIDFAEEPSSQTVKTKFRVRSIIWSGEDEIDPNSIDFGDLDAALLEVETTNSKGEALPTHAKLVKDLAAADRNREVIVVGYPAEPQELPVSETGDFDMEVIARLTQLFKRDYGTKYLAPGSILSSPDPGERDPNGWVFEHDATTLGGNSGSCVIGTKDPFEVIGLHFGGKWRHGNYAHSIGRVGGLGAFPSTAGLAWI